MKKIIVTNNQQEKIVLKEPGKYLVELAKPNTEVVISGAFQSQNEEQLSVEVVIHHQAPNTKAETTLKGVAKDESKIKLVGKIVIDENCEGAQSQLTERVLLLSPKAKAEVIPDLEIKTDDVKCSHAASISNLSSEHLFYLETRGLPRKVAENLVITGFLLE